MASKLAVTQTALFAHTEDRQYRRCPRCELSHPLSHFGRRSTNEPWPKTHCRSCRNAYHKLYYKAHSAKYKAWGTLNKRRYRLRNQQRIEAFLKTHPCVDCGEDDSIVLEFDHVRDHKVAEISNMVRDAIAWNSIEAEILKCEVRCANCHRRKTASQRKYKAEARGGEENITQTGGSSAW
jgi:hypothetical protein